MTTAQAHPIIDTVIFDLGGVLIDWNPRHLYRKLFGDDVDAMERFLREVCNTEWNEQQDAGRSWEDAVQEAIARHPSEATMIRAYHERWHEMIAGALDQTVACSMSCVPKASGFWRSPTGRMKPSRLRSNGSRFAVVPKECWCPVPKG